MILIDGLPRSGTTTLARVLGSHPDVRCLLEPFHPRRYRGSYHAMALASGSTASALSLLSAKYTLIKHVWEPATNWPFTGRPRLQEDLWEHSPCVIAVSRRNLLKRYVSAEISRRLRFWIGTRQQFLERLQDTPLAPIQAARAARSIACDQDGLAWRRRQLQASASRIVEVAYEDWFDKPLSPQTAYSMVNTLFNDVALASVSEEFFLTRLWTWFDPSQYKWAAADTYGLIPNSSELDRELGSPVTGRLFE